MYFINRFDAAKTCPEPWTHVDKKAKVLKVKICHLTQFALFWTFEAEYGILEFDKGTNGMLELNLHGERVMMCTHVCPKTFIYTSVIHE